MLLSCLGCASNLEVDAEKSLRNAGDKGQVPHKPAKLERNRASEGQRAAKITIKFNKL